MTAVCCLIVRLFGKQWRGRKLIAALTDFKTRGGSCSVQTKFCKGFSFQLNFVKTLPHREILKLHNSSHNGAIFEEAAVNSLYNTVVV